MFLNAIRRYTWSDKEKGAIRMNCLETMNTILMIAFLVCYAYQFFYILVPHIKKDKPHK